MRKFLLALLMVTLVAMPAFASVQNVKVSGDIDSTYLYRRSFDFGKNINGTYSSPLYQSLFLTQTRLRVDADLTDNVSTTVALINERVWSNDPSTIGGSTDNADTTVALNLAYVTLREMLYSPLTVVVGRQNFSYGNSFIVDSQGVNNSAPTDSGLGRVASDLTKQTAQDAVRLIFDYNPLKLEFLASKIATGNRAFSIENNDTDLLGANAVYSLGDSMNTQVEAYFFSRLTRTKSQTSGSVTKNDTLYVPGVRVSTNPIEGLNLQAEIAIQRGNKLASAVALGNERRDAFGGQLIANYKIPIMEQYKPMVQYVYTYVSGDKSNPALVGSATQASSEVWNAWDPMFENQAGGKIYNTLFSLSNASIHLVSLSANPMEDVTLKGSWTGLWLNERIFPTAGATNDSLTLLQPDLASTTGRAVVTSRGEHQIGNEFDLEAIYDYTEDVQIGANLGWFLPGDLFDAVNDSIASQAIVHANVNF